MDGIATKCCFSRRALGRMTLELKISSKIRMTWTSDRKNQQKYVWWEWHYSFLFSRPHEHGHFWLFFTIQRQGIEQTTNLLFILKVYFSIMKVLAKTTRGPVHLQLFRPSVIRGPCINPPQCARTDLNKRFLPKPMTTTGWKGTP